MTYSYITLAQARAAIAQRLGDLTQTFWIADELNRYIVEALRTWNAFTNTWISDFAFNPPTPAQSSGIGFGQGGYSSGGFGGTGFSAAVWSNLGVVSGSPRLRTVVDTDLYTLLEYHLLEPPVGGNPWQGTAQFQLSDLVQALQRRRDEILQITACTVNQLVPVNASPNVRRTVLPDTVLEIRRARFVPAVATFTPPVTLFREDPAAFQYFAPHFAQAPQLPTSYSIIDQPPLTLDANYAPAFPGQYDLIAISSGPVFAPPASTLVGMPDDWSWVAKWGALADLLSRDSEAADPLRAAYAIDRYQKGVLAMTKMPWIMLAGFVNQIPTGITSVAEMDMYAKEWEINPNAPNAIVEAGADLIAASPTSTGNGINVTVVQNAPVPVLDGDFIQASRDVLDVVLDYAQHLAQFKMGGEEFQESEPLLQNFILAASETNARFAELGIFTDVMASQGKRQEEISPRFKGGLDAPVPSRRT